MQDYPKVTIICTLKLKFGGNIAGLDVTVDLNGGNIRLLVTSTPGVDVTLRRMASGTFN